MSDCDRTSLATRQYKHLRCFISQIKAGRAGGSRDNLSSSGRVVAAQDHYLPLIARQTPAEVVTSLLSECEGGERGDISACDLQTGLRGAGPSTDQIRAGAVVLSHLAKFF